MAKIKTISELQGIVEELKKQNKNIVTTNGVFDILHIGHIRYLKEAKKLGDILIVGIRGLNGEKEEDVDGDFFDTTHFPQSLQQYPFRGYGLYAVKGKIVEEFGHPSIEVDKMVKLPLRPDPRLEEELKPGRLRGVDV